MAVVLVLLVTLGALTALLALVLPTRPTQVVTVACGLTCLGLALRPGRAGHAPVHAGFLRADAVSTVFVIATAFL